MKNKTNLKKFSSDNVGIIGWSRFMYLSNQHSNVTITMLMCLLKSSSNSRTYEIVGKDGLVTRFLLSKQIAFHYSSFPKEARVIIDG